MKTGYPVTLMIRSLMFQVESGDEALSRETKRNGKYKEITCGSYMLRLGVDKN
jgi:hypothetical protein